MSGSGALTSLVDTKWLREFVSQIQCYNAPFNSARYRPPLSVSGILCWRPPLSTPFIVANPL